MDVPFKTVLARGFFPEMPWSLYAMAKLPFWERGSKPFVPVVIPAPGKPPPVLFFELFRRRPFPELAQMLDKELERGFALLRDVTREDILNKGQVPQGRGGPFVNYPL